MPENPYEPPKEVGKRRVGWRGNGCLGAVIACAAPIVGFVIGCYVGEFVAQFVLDREISQLPPGQGMDSGRSQHALFGIGAGLLVWAAVTLSMFILAWFVWRPRDR